MLRYHNITKDDMLNGDGLRSVLWLSGCNHACKQCQNPITWDENYGLVFDEDAKKELFESLAPEYINGITLSGGDPLFPSNRDDVTTLVKEIKNKFPNKTVWLYTGYTFDEIKDLPIIKDIDVLIDGKFDIALLNNNLKWRGSSNQRVIDIKKTIELNQIVLHCS